MSTAIQKTYVEKIVYTMLAFMLVWSSLFAQEAKENVMPMSLGPQNGYSIDIDGADRKLVSDVWKDYMKEKDYGKTKYNKKAKEFYGADVKISRVNGRTPFSLYAKIDERADQTMVSIWADLGGYFVNSEEHSSAAEGMKYFLEDFYLAVKKKSYQNQIKDQEKVIKKAEKHQEKLIKKNEGYHKDIEKLKQKIVDRENDIADNLKEQEDQLILVEKEYERLEQIKEMLNNLGKEK